MRHSAVSASCLFRLGGLKTLPPRWELVTGNRVEGNLSFGTNAASQPRCAGERVSKSADDVRRRVYCTPVDCGTRKIRLFVLKSGGRGSGEAAMAQRSSANMQVQARQRAMAKVFDFAFLLIAGLGVSAVTAWGQNGLELRGERLTARFEVVHVGLKVDEIVDRKSGAKLLPGEAFSLQLRDGRVIAASQMKMKAAPVEEQTAATPAASREAARVAGRRVCADLSADDVSMAVRWCAVLREG